MADSFDNSLYDNDTKGIDPEIAGLLMVEKQKAQLNAQIHEFNDICWDKCVDKPGVYPTSEDYRSLWKTHIIKCVFSPEIFCFPSTPSFIYYGR